MKSPLGSGIEILEARIAPAAVTSVFADADGDSVTITAKSSASAAALQAALEAAASFSLEGSGLQLNSLDLSDPAFANAKITIVATRDGAEGDGFVAVGQVISSQTLKSISIDGDLGRYDVQTLGKLTVQSMGRYGTTTGAVDLFSSQNLGLNSLTVKEDIVNASISSGDGGIGKILIGGSLLGGDEVDSGTIRVPFINSITVGGNIEAGTGNRSGQISTSNSVDSIVIGGSLIGKKDNVFDNGSQIDIGNGIGLLKVGGDISATGLNGYGKPQVTAEGPISKIQVGGSLLGGPGSYQGSIGAVGMGSVKIGGGVLNLGPAFGAATINSTEGAIGSIAIAGDVTGAIVADGVGTIKIGGDLRGTEIQQTGKIDINGSSPVKSIAIGGSIVGGGDILTGFIDVSNDEVVLKLTVGGDIRSTSSSTGFIRAGTLMDVSVGGSIIASDQVGTEVDQISTVLSLGKLRVAGSVVGNVENGAFVDLGSESTSSVSVKGRVEYANFYNTGGSGTLGKMNVGGAWIASRLALGTGIGGDGIYGTGDDTFGGGTSSIGKLKIKGQAMGSLEVGDSYRIIAKTIGSFSAGGVSYAFGAGAQTQILGVTNDFEVKDQG